MALSQTTMSIKFTMFQELDNYHQAFERARCFEDDDEFFPGPLEETRVTQVTAGASKSLNGDAAPFTPNGLFHHREEIQRSFEQC
ncbi:hypothetical protein CLAFUW4_04018 [Fulvia fulva]|uniref:Uncharacterized protein n=1 Tax=Passalora fulva TaxID=5499 RepID=A0A9Q8LFI1_PASFU|nr:uncharacterized protein CLAFUR5_03983 [Fulvia fulva]KAK4626954.1 hypothetical protein CLAFUR4_04004 [Fulvia fulva]KAK4627500.1 hypothetical protein CLAFUR0_04005 [Fulvia fulva]UJO15713.1 hypothetical protein CLAFUR5_03983 [Fulvia fulva]WPV14315.1 hypothetical protein CLAFUW4_04018 [Fulvia fulva]WPV28475.1 hypothetical protein CLAFUW7_04007 [Fulvia fulva]